MKTSPKADQFRPPATSTGLPPRWLISDHLPARPGSQAWSAAPSDVDVAPAAPRPRRSPRRARGWRRGSSASRRSWGRREPGAHAQGGGPIFPSLLVTDEALFVGAIVGPRASIPRRGSQHDWPALARELALYRSLPMFEDGYGAIEVAATGEVRYHDLLAAMAVAHHADFHDPGLMAPDELSVRFDNLEPHGLDTPVRDAEGRMVGVDWPTAVSGNGAIGGLGGVVTSNAGGQHRPAAGLSQSERETLRCTKRSTPALGSRCECPPAGALSRTDRCHGSACCYGRKPWRLRTAGRPRRRPRGVGHVTDGHSRAHPTASAGASPSCAATAVLDGHPVSDQHNNSPESRPFATSTLSSSLPQPHFPAGSSYPLNRPPRPVRVARIAAGTIRDAFAYTHGRHASVGSTTHRRRRSGSLEP
jgi:hypothetical protein